MAHQTYEGNESQNEGSPILVIHGMLGLKKNWHTFCKSYSEQSGKQVRMVNFAGVLVLTQLLKHSPPFESLMNIKNYHWHLAIYRMG